MLAGMIFPGNGCLVPVRIKRQRIINRLISENARRGQISAKLLNVGIDTGLDRRESLPKALIVSEKEQLVLADGSAERSSKLILMKRLDGRGKKVAGVQAVIAQKLPGISVNFIRPAFGRNIDDGRMKAILRGEEIAHFFEFLN